MQDTFQQTVTVINFAICTLIAWLSICRLNTEAAKRCIATRIEYTLLLTGSCVSALQPILLKEVPTIGNTLLAGAVLIALAANLKYWKFRK